MPPGMTSPAEPGERPRGRELVVIQAFGLAYGPAAQRARPRDPAPGWRKEESLLLFSRLPIQRGRMTQRAGRMGLALIEVVIAIVIAAMLCAVLAAALMA